MRYPEISQGAGAEIVCPSVDLHIITPSPRLLDRLYLGEVLNLSSHILPYHQGERLRRFQ